MGALLALVCLVLAGCALQSTTDTEAGSPAHLAIQRLPLKVCEIDGIEEPLLCGTMEVYENRAARAGAKINIGVVVVPAQQTRLTNSAWIDHQGGPRYSMIAQARYFAEGGFLESFRRHRDIVLIDPRGLHESNPLYCEALARPRILERYYPPERVAACRAELDERADVTQYSTINAVDDYEDIREWLGYEQWDVGGWSYGSRFMLTYLHRHPESIRTITLLYPSILNFERPIDYARFGQQAFEGVVADCEADINCASAFPDPTEDLHAVLNRLEAMPERLEIINPDNKEREARVIDRDIFAESIWIALLKNGSARQVPFVLRNAAEGAYEPFIELTVSKTPQEPEPEGHYFAVICAEETSRIDMTRATEAAAGTFVGPYILKDYIEACDAWGAKRHPDHPLVARQFDTPALIITGDRDPVTPVEYGDRISSHFSNVRHITIAQMAHGAGGFENASCLDLILDGFIENASSNELDTSCLQSMRPPPFRIE